MPIVNLHTFEKRGKYFLVEKYGRRYAVISEREHRDVLAFKDRHGGSPFEEMEVTENELGEIADVLVKLHPDGEIGAKFDMPEHLRKTPALTELRANKTVLHLHVTGQCNLRCPWCYTGEKVDVVPVETSVQHAIDAITEGNKSGPFTIRFFGGEPLMNMDLIRKTVAHCEARSEKFDYTITTNGLLLNKANCDFLVEHKFLISISIMGYAAVHNRGRIFPNGTGSFDVVSQRCRDFFANYPDYPKVTANVTVPIGEFDYVKALRTLIDIGFRKIKMVGITDGVAHTDAEYERETAARRALLDFYVECLERGPRIQLTGLSYDPYIAMIENRNVVRRPSCRMHGQIAMDYNGNYLPCHRWMDEKIADVSTLVRRQKEIIDSVSYEGCSSCWAEYVCGKGVCYWKKEHYEKDIPGPTQQHCRMSGRLELIESAFYLHDYLRNHAPDVMQAAEETALMSHDAPPAHGN